MFNRATVISLFTGLSVAASLAGGPSIASAASPSASAAPKLASITPLNPGTNHVVTASPQPGSHPPVGQPQGGGSAGNGNGGGIEAMTL
jgi:transcription initiation factor TFIID subunit TAF12